MAELATIARPYAEALFQAARADLDGASLWLEEIVAVAADGDLQRFAADPKVTASQVFDLITAVVGPKLPDQGRNFLRTVLENRRLGALSEVAMQFRTLKNAQIGASDATVYSAFPIDDTVLSGLAASLESRFGRKLNYTVVLDETLIGGVRVVVGDEVLDTSVKARLEQMKVALTA